MENYKTNNANKDKRGACVIINELNEADYTTEKYK